MAALRVGAEDPVFDDLQRLVMRYTDDVVANVRASDATFDALAAHLSVQELQELTVTIGFYMRCRATWRRSASTSRTPTPTSRWT